MGQDRQRPELLAPAGSPEAFIAAVENGADAVYLGGKIFNARHFAKNFEAEEIRRLTRYAHLHGVRVYITLNILVLDRELTQALDYAYSLALDGVDGVIVQDLGLLAALGRLFTGRPEVHASTQMTLMNSWGVAFAQRLGASRVVLAREVSLANIRRIKAKNPMTLEAFGHGALCTAWSGQCLFSSMVGGRSGNRGQCAQPCRLPYQLLRGRERVAGLAGEEEYLLSTKDLRTLEFLEKMAEAGVSSYKLEGRMKQPEYVAMVIRQYHEQLVQNQEEQDRSQETRQGREPGQKRRLDILSRCFNRGFTGGYYRQAPGPHLMGRDKPNNRGEVDEGLLQEARDSFHQPGLRRRLPIAMSVRAFAGEPLFLKAKDQEGHEVIVQSSGNCERAAGAGINEERLRSQLDRLGNTVFSLAELTVDTDGQAFLPASLLNQLRRQLIEELEEARLKPYQLTTSEKERLQQRYQELCRSLSAVTVEDSGQTNHNRQEQKSSDSRQQEESLPVLTISVGSPEALTAALSAGLKEIYIDGVFFGGKSQKGRLEALEKAGRACAAAAVSWQYRIPRFIQEDQAAKEKEACLTAKACGAAGFVAANPGAIIMAEEWNLPLLTMDWPLNVCNSLTAELLKSYGPERICLSPELTLTQIKEMNLAGCQKEAVVHGRLPLMILEHCLPGTLIAGKTGKLCSRWGGPGEKPCLQGDYFLEDRLGLQFPVKTDRDCRNWLFNAKTHSLLEHLFALGRAGVSHWRIEAADQSPQWIAAVADIYRQTIAAMARGENGKAVAKSYRPPLQELAPQGYTTGHYFRGLAEEV